MGLPVVILRSGRRIRAKGHPATVVEAAAIGEADVLATVVLYRKPAAESETLCTLDRSCEQAGLRMRTLLYDNSPERVFDQAETDRLYPNLEIEYLHDPSNPGVSRAYNVGLERGRSADKRWLLLLDQDSNLGPAFIERTLRSVACHPDVDLHLPVVSVAGRPVSPVKLVLGRGVGSRFLRKGMNGPTSFFAVNSGMLIRARYLEEIGGYDERFTLYFTDNWFCDRYHGARKPFAITDAVIDHDLSIESCTDRDKRVKLYRLSIQGSRMLYRRKPLILALITLTGVVGAVRRAIANRDSRYLAAFFGCSG